MEISCAFPTSLDTPEHVALAEELGYARAWLYDTPQQSPDVWMVLALCAARTSRIGLGPGVLVPSLRHPMVNAAATVALAALAPGRVSVAFGTGFTGRRAMGSGQLSWASVSAYLRAYRGLLAGEVVEWEGARTRMLHPEGHGAPRPVDVPVLVGAMGPKGAGVARDLGDGVFATRRPPEFLPEFGRAAFLAYGTVLDEGEDIGAPRVRAAGGPGWALEYHAAYEYGGADAVAKRPGGAEWLRVVERAPQAERHLAVHEGHCVALNEADVAAWEAGGSAVLERVTLSGTPERVRERLDRLAAAGVTELVYQPCGPDVRRELDAMLAAARG